MIRYAAFFVWIGCFALGASAQTFEWPRSTPAQVNVSEAGLADLENELRSGTYGQVTSFLLLRHGKVAFERYFRGHTEQSEVPLYSVTKSWASALMGAAVAQGRLAVDQSLETLMPGYAPVFQRTPSLREIQLQDLLTMRHGLAWDEWSTAFTNSMNPVNQMTRAADWWESVLTRPVTAAADTVFRYSTGVSNLLGGIVYEQMGVSADEYAQTTLFGELSIGPRYYEVDLTGGPRGSGITRFQPGLTPTGHGLWMRPADLAKLGQLYLDGGVWQTRRLLEESWIADSWKPHSDHETDPEVFPAGLSYGYQWWSQRYPTAGGPVDVHFAWGFADQFVFVVPALDLVVVSTAANTRYDGPTIRSDFARAVLEKVGPDFDAVTDGGLTGSWYAPELSGQGFMFEVVPQTGQIVAYWMTFDPVFDQQMWLFAVGELHGRRAMLQFRRPLGGTFGEPSQTQFEPWGDAELVFTSCTEAAFSFTSQDQSQIGQLALQRITPSTTCS